MKVVIQVIDGETHEFEVEGTPRKITAHTNQGALGMLICSSPIEACGIEIEMLADGVEFGGATPKAHIIYADTDGNILDGPNGNIIAPAGTPELIESPYVDPSHVVFADAEGNIVGSPDPTTFPEFPDAAPLEPAP